MGTRPGPLTRKHAGIDGGAGILDSRTSSTGPPRTGSASRPCTAFGASRRRRLFFLWFCVIAFAGRGLTRRVIVRLPRRLSKVPTSLTLTSALSVKAGQPQTLRTTPWPAPSLPAGQNILEAARGQAFDSRRSSRVWRLSGEGPKAANSLGLGAGHTGTARATRLAARHDRPAGTLRTMREACPVPVTGQGRAPTTRAVPRHGSALTSRTTTTSCRDRKSLPGSRRLSFRPLCGVRPSARGVCGIYRVGYGAYDQRLRLITARANVA